MAFAHKSMRPGRLGCRLAALALIAALGGCSSELAYYTPAETPKQSTIEWVTFAHTVGFGERGTEIPPAERHKLERFLAEVEVRERDQVQVGVDAEPANPGAELLAGQREKAVRKVLRQRRRFADALPRSADAGAWDGSVTVKIGRWLLTPPKCPFWNEAGVIDNNNQPVPALGCTTAALLDMHVANPGDLVRGGDPGATDAEGSAYYLRKWRTGERQMLPIARPDGSFESQGREVN